MSSLKYVSAVLFAAFLASSCEPLPPYPRDQRPYRTAVDRERDRYERDTRQGNRQDDGRSRYDDRTDGYRPNPGPSPTRDSYPTAERTANPSQVISPYKPFNVIDVEGFRSGQLAKDPSNGKIFRVP